MENSGKKAGNRSGDKKLGTKPGRGNLGRGSSVRANSARANSAREGLDGPLSRRQQNLQVSNRTQLLFILAGIGTLGVLVFGYLMERALAPAREASVNGFSSFGEMLIIPGFLGFGLLLVFAMRELYKIYRVLNDPNTYRSKSRRSRRTQLR